MVTNIAFQIGEYELMKKGLSEPDFLQAAVIISCSIETIKALAEVEGNAEAFLPNNEPMLWFHHDVFSRRTGGVYDTLAPEISCPKAGNYGAASEQHDRLHQAMLYNKEAALMSAGWGRFQIMGYNYELAGFDTLQAFISAMYKSEKEQLMAFIHYLKSLALDEDLRNTDWKAFASKYKKTDEQASFIARLNNAYIKFKTSAGTNS
ncbi:N-acetylmuramidase domain-containing protein [Niabella aquatica]